MPRGSRSKRQENESLDSILREAVRERLKSIVLEELGQSTSPSGPSKVSDARRQQLLANLAKGRAKLAAKRKKRK